MTNKILLLLVIILSFDSLADSLYVSPSFYYTYGNYSDKSTSKSFAFYNSLQLSFKNYLINSYDNLLIKTSDWNYKQQTFSAGIYSVYFPYFFKFNYSHIKGDYRLKDFPDFDESSLNYSDFTNLYSLDFIYYQNLFYFGAALTYQNAIGKLSINQLEKQRVGQITLRFENIFSPDIFLSVKPNYTFCTDGRKLFSVAAKIHYLISPYWLIKAGGFAGKRAYYFDTDLITIFNQPQTQYWQGFVQLDYFPSLFWKFTLNYQYTKFETYKINYFTAGVKTALEF